MCQLKELGGMGLREMFQFNLARPNKGGGL